MSMDAPSLPNDVEQLKALIARQSVALAEREREIAQREVVAAQRIAELIHRDTVIAQKEALIVQKESLIAQNAAVIASLQETVEQQLSKLERAHQQLARLLRQRYGPQKERIDPNQLTLFSAEDLSALIQELEQTPVDSVLADDASAEDQPVADAMSKKSKGHGRRRIPPDIPREIIVHELSEEERVCPCCGLRRAEIGREVSEQLEFIPARLKVLRHERVRYACAACEENVALASKPPQPIEKGLPGPGLLAHLTLAKYGDYLPLYRLEDILSRCGILLRRSTLCGWIAQTADLLKPLYEQMCQRVLRSRVIHTDDTGIKMLSEGQCQNCKFWTYVGDKTNPFAVYEFSLTREGKNPSRFLEGFTGYLQADAFSGYDQVYAQGQVIEVACLAHCRRYWWEAKETDPRRAHEALGYIGRLYQLETQFEHSGLIGEALCAARQQHSVPILDEFQAWLRKEQILVLPKSPIGQAFTYTLNQWQALCRYTEDGILDIDNNLAERLVKLPAILRKNALFVGSEEGGHRAAILLSIVASAKLCQVEPWVWLNAVITELPLRLASSTGPPDQVPDLTDLLPDEWIKHHPEHRWKIDDLRKVERDRSRRQKTGKRKSKGR
jgi:transposase